MRSLKLKAVAAAMALFYLGVWAISAEALAPSSKVEEEGPTPSRAEGRLHDLMPGARRGKQKREEDIRTIEESMAYLLSQKQEIVGLDLHTVGLLKDYLNQPATAGPLYKLLRFIKTNEELAKAIIGLEAERDRPFRYVLITELIRRNEGFIANTAIATIRKFGVSDSFFEDLQQVGRLVFYTKINNYDKSRGTVLGYMGACMNGEMSQFLSGWLIPITIPEYVQNDIARLVRIERELSASFHRDPSLDELVEGLSKSYPQTNWSVERVLELQSLMWVQFISLDAPSRPGEENIQHILIENEKATASFEQSITNEGRSRVKTFVDSLPNLRHRLILDLVYGFTMKPKNLTEVGRILGFTEESIGQENKRALQQLKVLMERGTIRPRERGEEESSTAFSTGALKRRMRQRDFLLERFVIKTGSLTPYFGLLYQPNDLLRYKMALIQELFGDLGIDPVRDWVILLRDRYRLVDELNAVRDSPGALAQFKANLRAEQEAKEREIETRFRADIERFKNELAQGRVSQLELAAHVVLSQSL